MFHCAVTQQCSSAVVFFFLAHRTLVFNDSSHELRESGSALFTNPAESRLIMFDLLGYMTAQA